VLTEIALLSNDRGMRAERKKGTLLWEQPVWIYTMYLANGLADPLFPIQRNSFFTTENRILHDRHDLCQAHIHD
jgi:hypothetical protein